ncbi:MAG: hypothetical protein SGCHY_004547 [Lobulomycetales sp.]
MCDILSALPIGDYTIKLNNRKILDGMFEVCGVPEDKVRAISSAVDKLDKMSWSDVYKEMTEEKGLDPGAAACIEKYVVLKSDKGATSGGLTAFMDSLEAMPEFSANARVAEGLTEMRTLAAYLDAFGVASQVQFDLSLARGLDYYTGVIYEAVAHSKDARGVGSVASGGRYDNLVGMFSSGGSAIPCVGMSIGVERIFSLVMKSKNAASIKAAATQVLVCGIADGNLTERMAICRELWQADIPATFQFKDKVKLAQQFKICERDAIPVAVIVGATEIEQGVLGLKDQTLTDAQQKQIPRGELVAEVRALLDEQRTRVL